MKTDGERDKIERPKILVIACGPWDYGTLRENYFHDRFQFFFEEITTDPKNIDKYISYIIDKYRPQRVDGVLGTHDGPESLVAAIIAREFGLQGLDPRKAFICEHKYYSREAQRELVPSAVPEFQYLSIDGLKRDDVTLSYPFFVKPVKSAFSMLARPIENFETLEAFLPKVQRRLSQAVPAFNSLIKKYTSLELDANLLIAEQMLDGEQVTVEGFSWNKDVTIMGIVDSVMYPGTMSFERFEYPSKLPIPVQERMMDIASDLIFGMGVDFTVFNIEMFYNHESDAIHVIEINPRMSYQFADIFEKVDGINTYAIQLQLSQGKQPEFKKGNGRFGVAASFVLRLFEDMKVTRTPTEAELGEICAQFPDSFVINKVKEGTQLSDVSQDESSYRYAIINLGGKDWTDLYFRFERLKRNLRFEFEPYVDVSGMSRSRELRIMAEAR
jgi:hypothetical protein